MFFIEEKTVFLQREKLQIGLNFTHFLNIRKMAFRWRLCSI